MHTKGHFFLIFRDKVCLCYYGCPRIHPADQAGLDLRDLLTSTYQILGLKARATTTWQKDILIICFVVVSG